MDAKRRGRREGQRKDRKGDGGKDKEGLGYAKKSHGIEKEIETAKKAKKMDRTKEWYSERKTTEGRNKKEEWMQREEEEERESEKR